jgi:concentrative nucleoside transporter, CNT family
MERLISVLGVGVLLGLAVLLSRDRRRIDWRLVAVGLGLQFAFAALVHLFPPGRAFFGWLREGVTTLLNFTFDGSRFLFGSLMEVDGPVGMVFAFRVLPTIVFFSSLMAVLYHVGLMQKVVTAMARGMARTMRVSGSESLSVAANVFIGQTEAPLVVRPYIAKMTESELMVLMTGGMATIAGGVLAGYIAFGIDAGHLLAASVMSAPAALVTAKILVPEREKSLTRGKVEIADDRETVNLIDAAADGAGQGLTLALNVGAMLLAFVALIALVDAGLGQVSAGLASVGVHGWPASLQEIFGYLLWPIAWSMGVPTADCFTFAGLLGQKLAINEFVAYASLGDLVRDGAISERSAVIGTYALCGFANFGSIAIQIGGIGGLAPERRADLSRLGLRAMAGGALASWLTATIAGIML